LKLPYTSDMEHLRACMYKPEMSSYAKHIIHTHRQTHTDLRKQSYTWSQ